MKRNTILKGFLALFTCISIILGGLGNFMVYAVTENIAIDAQTWVSTEISFESENNYNKPFYDVTLDVVFTHSDGTKITVPAFWDGENIWKVRFAPTKTGVWEYKTVCNQVDNGLNSKTGYINATAYSGELGIYKHGFLKTVAGVRYFMYDDGTAFFYIGDTHWNMVAEEFDEAGDHAGDLDTNSHFKYIVDKRVEQGFTVYQSEPIDAEYQLNDGFSHSDISGFQKMDKYFQYIAQKGLVHANAQLFFVSELANKEALEKIYTPDYLELLSRYWVARYCSYPVLWTTAQEVDDDFYRNDRNEHDAFDRDTNPWKTVATAVHKYDPYSHPLSAHQEYTDCTTASNSSFRDLEGHTWYAAQWAVWLDTKCNYEVPKDYWYNGQGKVTVNYEGRYDHLWTKHYGSRVQGWTAFLNGMFGYGYGAVDIWLYKSVYDTDTTSNDGVDKITPEDKAKHWSESVEFESAYQMGYMRQFFESFNWWELTPDFDNKNYFSPHYYKARYACSTINNNTYVVYFYNQTKLTGILKGLDKSKVYSAKWFNPRTNEYIDISNSVKANSLGQWFIPLKPDSNDWLLYVTQGDTITQEKSFFEKIIDFLKDFFTC